MKKAKKTTKTPRQRRASEKKRAKKAAEDAMSLYIRERDNWTCYTCGMRGDKTNMDNGHLITASRSGTKFHEKNCHCQCKGCNRKHEDDYEPYRRKFVEQYGEEYYNELYVASWEIMNYTTEDYRDFEKYFKEKLAELRTERL